MSLKRITPFGGEFPVKKRSKVSQISLGSAADDLDESKLEDLLEIPNDTMAALMYLKSIFPINAFSGRIPAIVLKHQLYSIVKDKTIVDRQLNDLWEKNEVRLFKLTSGSDEFAVVMTSDYVTHVTSKMTDNTRKTTDKFLNHVLPNCIDVSFGKSTLLDNQKLTEVEITHLISMGVLAVRDVGSWWLSIPGVGAYMKNFMKGFNLPVDTKQMFGSTGSRQGGVSRQSAHLTKATQLLDNVVCRKALIRLLKNRRYKEILQKDLETRSLSNQSKLGMTYHLHDIIGAELVKSIETTSGQLLRLERT